MPNLLANEHYIPTQTVNIDKLYTKDENMKRKPFVSEEHMQRHFGVEESRKILYEDDTKRFMNHNGPEVIQYSEMKPYENGVKKQVIQNAHLVRPPQPVLPPKPRSRESVEREITMR